MNNNSEVKKRVIIFGCGRVGKMAAKWLGPDCELIGFTDNDQEKWGRAFGGVKIFSPADAVRQGPDLIWIAIVNRSACSSVEKQLMDMGYNGKIYNIDALREVVDLRLAALRMIAEEVRHRQIPGEMAELGVYRGRFAAEMNRLFPERKLYLFDTFEGFDQRDIDVELDHGFSRAQAGGFNDTSESVVRDSLPHSDRAVFKKGYFPDTAAGIDEYFALVSIDADLYQPVYEGMKYFYPKLSSGGCIIVHDYNNAHFKGVGEAVRRYCREHMIFPVPLCDLHGSAIIVKQ